MTGNDRLLKVTSRKFLISAALLVCGLVLYLAGLITEETLRAVLVSAGVGYVAAEGLVDAVRALRSTATTLVTVERKSDA